MVGFRQILVGAGIVFLLFGVPAIKEWRKKETPKIEQTVEAPVKDLPKAVEEPIVKEECKCASEAPVPAPKATPPPTKPKVQRPPSKTQDELFLEWLWPFGD